MSELKFQFVEVRFEAFFERPVLFRDADFPKMSPQLLESFESYGLKPTQISLRHGDLLFDYELSASLFNGNGTIKISCERMLMEFKNALSAKDIEIVTDCALRAISLPLKPLTKITISANTHATMPTAQDVHQYLTRNAKPDLGILSCGTIATLRTDPWPDEIRLTIDQSLGFPNGLFISWSTVHKSGQITREQLDVLGKSLVDSLSKFDLSVASN